MDRLKRLSAPMNRAPLEVGMYVLMSGGSPGRIVDRTVIDGTLWWIVKTTTGQIVRARSSRLAPRG